MDRFFTNFLEHKSPARQAQAPFSSLDRQIQTIFDRQIQTIFDQEFGPPLTSRMHLFVPCYPFNLGEQTVVAHKYMLEQSRSVGSDISVKGKNSIKHIHVSVANDGQVFQ